jgi:hypothetical protein
MGDPALGKLPRHIQLTDFDISLERGDARYPMRPVVQGLRLRVSDRGLHALAHVLVDEADRRAPVGIKLRGLQVGPQGIELSARMTKSIFSSDLATRLVLSAPGGNELRVELTDTDVPAWVPLEMLLDEAAKRGGDGVRRDPGNRNALLLDPAALLVRGGVPGRFAPGRWDVTTSADGLVLTFRESAGGA